MWRSKLLQVRSSIQIVFVDKTEGLSTRKGSVFFHLLSSVGADEGQAFGFRRWTTAMASRPNSLSHTFRSGHIEKGCKESDQCVGIIFCYPFCSFGSCPDRPPQPVLLLAGHEADTNDAICQVRNERFFK